MAGYRVPLSAGLADRLSPEKVATPTAADGETLAAVLQPVMDEIDRAKTLYLIADGALEFLPWAAAPVGRTMLAERMPLVFLSSLSHLKWATATRNLYSARYP